MKKLLALVLALVMSMSLVTISNADFKDADKIEHTEAVEVMNALGVINGLPDGSFGPDGNVTRAQMAKMITIIMLGDVDASAFVGTTTDLTDIAGHWAEGYIKYCYSQGIIAGTGNGKFEPDANVTAVQAAKMLLVAIGYNSDVQGYTGADWAINVTRDAQLSGFYAELKGLTSTKVLTRDEAAQMIYNAVDTGIVVKTPNWNSSTGVVTYSYQKQSDSNDLLKNTFDVTPTETVLKETSYDSEKAEYTYTLADSINGSVYVKSTADYSDLFGMNVKVLWTKDKSNDTVVYGIYAVKSTVLAEGVVGDIDLAKASDKKMKLGDVEYKLEGTNTTIFVKDNDSTSLGTNVAAPTQGYYSVKLIDKDGNGKVDFIVYTPATVAKVVYVGKTNISVNTDYGATTLSVKNDTIYTGIAKDDYAVITKGLDGNNVVEKLEKFTATVSKIKSYDSSVTTSATKLVAGETYKIADISKDTITSANIGKDLTAVAYNGYLFYTDASSKAGIDKFAMLVKAEASATGLNKHPQAILLMTDGTEKTVDLADTNAYTSAGNMVKFSVTDDLYTLVSANNAVISDVDFDGYAGNQSYVKNNAKTNGGYLLSDDAVVFCKDSKGNWIVATGADVKKGDNDLYQAFYKTVKATGYNTIEICTMSRSINVSNSNYAVVFSGLSTVENDKNEKVAEFDIWTVDGKVTVTTTNTYASLSLAKGDVITYTDKGDGVITVDSKVAMTESAVVAYSNVANSDGEYDIAFAGGSASSGIIAKGTPADAIIDEDTVVLYIDLDDTTYTGIEGGEIRLATETATPNSFYTNVKYNVSGTPSVVKVLVVEVDNNYSDVNM